MRKLYFKSITFHCWCGGRRLRIIPNFICRLIDALGGESGLLLRYNHRLCNSCRSPLTFRRSCCRRRLRRNPTLVRRFVDTGGVMFVFFFAAECCALGFTGLPAVTAAVDWESPINSLVFFLLNFGDITQIPCSLALLVAWDDKLWNLDDSML